MICSSGGIGNLWARQTGSGETVRVPLPNGLWLARHALRVTAAVCCDDVTKRFGATLAIDRLSLEVETGEVLGFLGPNGAGKSTTIRILVDLLRPSAGSVQVLGLIRGVRVRGCGAASGISPATFRCTTS
jgi:ABC-type multidrug transport system fused ATPase/permease subunit